MERYEQGTIASYQNSHEQNMFFHIERTNQIWPIGKERDWYYWGTLYKINKTGHNGSTRFSLERVRLLAAISKNDISPLETVCDIPLDLLRQEISN